MATTIMGKNVVWKCTFFNSLQQHNTNKPKKRNADFFKVYLHPEKCPSSGRFNTTSINDLSKESAMQSIQTIFNTLYGITGFL